MGKYICMSILISLVSYFSPDLRSLPVLLTPPKVALMEQSPTKRPDSEEGSGPILGVVLRNGD